MANSVTKEWVIIEAYKLTGAEVIKYFEICGPDWDDAEIQFALDKDGFICGDSDSAYDYENRLDDEFYFIVPKYNSPRLDYDLKEIGFSETFNHVSFKFLYDFDKKPLYKSEFEAKLFSVFDVEKIVKPECLNSYEALEDISGFSRVDIPLLIELQCWSGRSYEGDYDYDIEIKILGYYDKNKQLINVTTNN